MNDSIGFCSSAATSLLRTTDAGITWNLISDTLYSINYLSSYGNLMFMGLAYRNLYRSTDLGENWTLSFNFPAIIKQVSMFDSNVGLMAYNYDDYISMGDILLTIDGGLTWEDWGSTLKFHFGISDVEFEGTDKGWVATNYKILKTTDAGVNWDSLSSPYPIQELEFFNDNVSYGTDFFHIYYTDDGWITYSIADSILTSVEDREIPPGSFVLSQNYPNPFNPVTTIDYKIPKGVDVKLRLINLLGEEISVLVDQFQTAGEYSIEFDPDYNLTSGVYIYQLEAGEFRETRKMVYLK